MLHCSVFVGLCAYVCESVHVCVCVFVFLSVCACVYERDAEDKITLYCHYTLIPCTIVE